MGSCAASACEACNSSPEATPNKALVEHRATGSEPVPLLLHFDVNKTVLLSDSVQMKTIETGLREGIGDLFWGTTREEQGESIWEWSHDPPSSSPPGNSLTKPDGTKQVTYVQYCKVKVKDKNERKAAVSGFTLVREPEAKDEMEKLLRKAMEKMTVEGNQIKMLPAVFSLVAMLMRSNRKFAILFRSFGTDHEKIKHEWNDFCEMKHPVFSSLLDGIGPLDGSAPGRPDKRIQRHHTLYRDAEGPVLILDMLTNGPESSLWDTWAKAKPKPATDTRDGRNFARDVLKANTVEGFPNTQQWMKQLLNSQETATIKDDWAWWQWNGETSAAGKLLTIFGEETESRQLFFDDNIDYDGLRIVDCRDACGNQLPETDTLNKVAVAVNPVEALLDDGYFARKLLHSYQD